MPTLVPLALAVGIAFPEALEPAQPATPWLLALIIASGTSSVRLSELLGAARKPAPILATLGVVHLVMPLIALGLGRWLFADQPEISTGMLVEFIVPVASAGFTWVAITGGSLALALLVVVVDTMLAPIVIPLSVHLLLGTSVRIDPMALLVELALLVALPAALGLALNEATKGAAGRRLQVPAEWWTRACMLSISATRVAGYIRSLDPQLVKVTLTMCAVSLLGWGGARLLRLDHPALVSMTFDCGMRNIAIGVVLAATYFPGKALLPVILCTLFQQRSSVGGGTDCGVVRSAASHVALASRNMFPEIPRKLRAVSPALRGGCANCAIRRRRRPRRGGGTVPVAPPSPPRR